MKARSSLHRCQTFTLFTLFVVLTLPTACGPSKPKGIAPDVGIDTLLQAPRTSLKSLKELEGQAVVLEFWATWCAPCVRGIPAMNKMEENFRGRPVQFISVTNEKRETVEAFLRTHEMKPWIGLDPDHAATDAFKVRGFPTIFVIDRYGRIWHKVDPMFFYKSDVEDALDAPSPTPAGSAK